MSASRVPQRCLADRGGVGGAVRLVHLAGLTTIGTKILPEPQTKSDVGELMRTTGFASAPAVFHLLARLPLIGAVASFAVSVCMPVAMVIAVRQALDYRSIGRAVGVCVIGWLVYVAVAVFIRDLSGLR